MTIKFRELRDLLAQTDETERIARSTRENPILGPAIANIPFLNRALPPAERATRGEPFGVEPPIGVSGIPFLRHIPGGEIQAPTFRQTTGFIVGKKTLIERELDRLEVNPNPRTGDPTIDRLVRERMNTQVEKLNKIVESPAWQRRSDRERRLDISDRLETIRSRTKAQVLAQERPRIVRELTERLRNQPLDRALDELDKLQQRGSINRVIRAQVEARLRQKA